MGLYIFAAFVIIPIIEIVVLIELGSALGTIATIALIIATAALGTYLLRHQGRTVLARAQTELTHGRLPAAELFEGLCLFAAGLLLLTPGLITDAVGGLLLIPAIRRGLQKYAAQHFSIQTSHMHQNFYRHHPTHQKPDTKVYDADFTVIEPDPPQPEKPQEDLTPPHRTLH